MIPKARILVRSSTLHKLCNNSQYLTVSCAYDLFIKLWNVENDYQNFATLRGHEHSVSSSKFLPGDDRIISSSRDQTVRIWEIATTYVDHVTRHCMLNVLSRLSLSHCIKVIRPHSDWIRCAIPNTDGKFFITCSMDHVWFLLLVLASFTPNHS